MVDVLQVVGRASKWAACAFDGQPEEYMGSAWLGIRAMLAREEKVDPGRNPSGLAFKSAVDQIRTDVLEERGMKRRGPRGKRVWKSLPHVELCHGFDMPALGPRKVPDIKPDCQIAQLLGRGLNMEQAARSMGVSWNVSRALRVKWARRMKVEIELKGGLD